MDKTAAGRMEYLVDFLNKCCDEYYNGSTPSLSDAEYDRLFDELEELENKTGVILPDSPTQRAGFEAVSELQKVVHPTELLSLAKTKDAGDIEKMLQAGDGFLSLKLDGLTVELDYKNGELTEASTRGDGTVGEIITHNARVFTNIPLTIPYTDDLTVTGEAFIDIPTFESINEEIDNDEDRYSTPRNLAAGSVRQLDSKICSRRGVKFLPFNVLKGLDDIPLKSVRLEKLVSFGFGSNLHKPLAVGDRKEKVQAEIDALKADAAKNGLPIDGIVFSYDNVEFARSLGKTSHHFKDGIAYKFGDPTAETVFKHTEWNISRTGQLTPVAVFDPVDIDNTKVERASLHNITFIEGLELEPGDRIIVSKRNMIIPHIEKNITAGETGDRDGYTVEYPENCPVCGKRTEIKETNADNRLIKVLYCTNSSCAGHIIKKLTHFVSKQAMNIDGLSEATLEKFVAKGFIKETADIYSLPKFRDEITVLDGFGEKSFGNLCSSIEASRNTKLSNLLVAMNIPLIGKSAAADISKTFGGDAEKLLNAVDDGYDFSKIEGFGSIMNDELQKWFADKEKRAEFEHILSLLSLTPDEQITEENSKWAGKTVVITGTFSAYTRDELTEILQKSGAKVTGSVSKRTDIVLCGENAGSKLDKAKSLGITVIYEDGLDL